MKIKDLLKEGSTNVSINGLLYSLNNDERKVYNKVKSEKKLFKKDLDEFLQRVAGLMVTRGLLTRKKTKQNEIYFTTRGRNKVNKSKPLDEVAPPDKKIESWITKNKDKFKMKYGKDYKKFLYGKAWNKFNGKPLEEGYVKKIKYFNDDTNLPLDMSYIDFEVGMRFIDLKTNETYTIEKIIKWGDYDYGMGKEVVATSDSGKILTISSDQLSEEILDEDPDTQKYRMIYDEKFFKPEDIEN